MDYPYRKMKPFVSIRVKQHYQVKGTVCYHLQ